MATINDIAKASGVSKATVSNVFTKKKTVSEEVSRKVLEVCRQYNYFPSKIASSLVTKKTSIIGLLLENGEQGFKKIYGDLISGVLASAVKHNYKVLLDACTDDREQLQTSLVSKSDPIDGCIIHGVLVDDMRIGKMLKYGVPFVLIGRTSGKRRDSVLSVDVDNMRLCYDITVSLIKLGHTRIGFLNSKPNMTITFDRIKGHMKALGEYGIEFDPSLIYNSDHSFRSGYEMSSRLMEYYPDITAIVTCSDEVASGAYEAICDRNLRIPEDISVVALGGEDYYQKLDPILTTVAIDYKLIGEVALELLLKRINHQQIDSETVLIETKILEGRSCAASRRLKA